MALYAALTFWLVVIMFSAWGVHRLWSAMIKPRVVNSILLPGTLVAQLGHVLGLLLSGNAVQNTALMSDDEEGDPQTETPETTRLPIVGPVLVGLLPLVACGAGLHFSAQWWGGRVLSEVANVASASVPQELPTTLAGFWDLLRGTITLMEVLLNTILHSGLPQHWPTALFLYLAICLTVRMAPFEGNQRGAIGAVVVAGLLISVLSSLVPSARTFVQESSWPILSFAVGMLLFLLLVTLLIRGVVGLIRVLAQSE